MPPLKDPPPRRRLGRSNGDNIIALFEGSSSSPSKTSKDDEKSSTTTKPPQDENEQIITSLFPLKTTKNQDKNLPAPESFNDNNAPPPLPAPRNINKQLVSTEVQTITGGAEFRIYELVLTAAPNSSGVVTREHAAHRAMLERQISQRIVDARLDERFNRQSIEDAWAVATEAVSSAFLFHAQAIRDFMYLKEEENRIVQYYENEDDGDDDQNEFTDEADVNRRMINKMNEKLNLAICGNNNNNRSEKNKIPRFVPAEKYRRVLDENVAMRDRIDLLERRLTAQSQGIPFLVNTIRFPPPPPSVEVLEAEEGRVRSRLLNLEDELITNLVSIWGSPPAHLVRQYRAARQQQQQLAAVAMPLEQKIQQNVVEVEAKCRGDVELEENQEFDSEIQNTAAANFFTSVIRDLNREKELYRLRSALLVVEASEESSRSALTETVLDVRRSLLETFYDETKIKSDLTRRLRGSLQDQHNQAMRHKKEISKNLPPVADRVPPKNSVLSKITPEARRAAALALTEQGNNPNTKNINTPNTARNLEKEMALPGINDHKNSSTSNSQKKNAAAASSSSVMTPRPPQQQQQQQPGEGSTSKRTLGGFASSFAKSALYNSGFSRAYENL